MASKGIPEKFHPPVTLILPKRMFGSKKVERALEQTGVSSFHDYTTTSIETQHFATFVCKLTMKASF